MTARELTLFETVSLTVRSISEEFAEPDDDWEPMAFLEGEIEGETGVATMPLGYLMGDDDMKDRLANHILPFAIKEFSATKLIFVMSVWSSEKSVASMATGKYIPPSKCDDRTEHVLLMEYTAEGVTRQAWAQITRHEGKPPTLGEWEQKDGVSGFSGRFVDPLVTALKEVAA